MDEELNIIVLEDDAGNELTMKVIDYFYYEGKEYALMTEYVEDADEEADEGDEIDVAIMEIVPINEEEEEFRPIDDALAEKILTIYQNDEFDDIYEDDEDEE